MAQKPLHTVGMEDAQVPEGILLEDWSSTPVSVRELILSLQETIDQLWQRISGLEEQINKNSRNSSKPPSSDPPNKRVRPNHVPSGRKAGGQPGHVGYGRSLKPLGEVDRIVDVKPLSCDECGLLLLGEDPQPRRHQVTELPRIVADVIEYRCHSLVCLACGAKTGGQWPEEMPSGSFGPRVQATVGYLAGRIGISQRDVQEIMETLLGTDMSLGSVPAIERVVSCALSKPVAAVQTYVQHQPVTNVDETGWRECGQRTWLWISCAKLATSFLLTATRGSEGAKELLSESFEGIVGSDRWSAYSWLEPKQRQLCWAHLRRDFQAFVDRGDESERIGSALLEQTRQMFNLWHYVRGGSLGRADFQAAMLPVMARVGELLREGTTLEHDKTRRTCNNILKLEVSLWTFVDVANVEPTNNDAERPLRRAVLWRRKSFGTQSEAGSRFVERVLTTVTTLRQQKRDVLGYLTQACDTAIRGDKPPSLLPEPQTTNSPA